ncbi:MAG: hypothetical protein C4332_01080 [Meiothermus sp.]
MIPLETYLATHLRYTVWATRRTLRAVRQLSQEEYLRDLVTGHGSVRGTLEHMLGADRGWYALLAGEPAGVETPEGEYYAEFGHLETDHSVILARYEQLASFLTDLELAAYFANSRVYVPWLKTQIPKWQGVMNVVSHATYHRGQIAAMIHQLGHSPLKTDLVYYYVELEGKTSAS